ncbi:MAG: 16S rRNA (cytidine(1402)-2'-O)-methyltransferase [Pseudomonadota bacterium]
MSEGVLYVVATPIGNLDDVTFRAVKVLQAVDLIAAEDTRHTRPLLRHYGIHTPMVAVHEHNEQERLSQLLERLESGESLALVSDAGTPLISDPGFPLVREAARRGVRVIPIPGPSALISALSAAGLPTDRFLFAGFPPRHASRRISWLKAMDRETSTLVFYESSHRIIATLTDMAEAFGGVRHAVIARELTKLYETFLRGTISQLLTMVEEDPDQQRGEFVILVHGSEPRAGDPVTLDETFILQLLAAELPVKQAASLVARITGRKKNDLYQKILKMKGQKL